MINFFSLFNLKESADLDPEAIHVRYLELQKIYHPDSFAHENSSVKISDVNHGYRILINENLRIKHFLELKGYIPSQLPKERLVQIMEIAEDSSQNNLSSLISDQKTKIKQMIGKEKYSEAFVEMDVLFCLMSLDK